MEKKAKTKTKEPSRNKQKLSRKNSTKKRDLRGKEKAKEKVSKVMHEFKEGKLKMGKSNKKVKSRKQAIAIGLSEAREGK